MLAQLRQDGYIIFLVRGALPPPAVPRSAGDPRNWHPVARLLAHASHHPKPSARAGRARRRAQRGRVMSEEDQLAEAMRASLADAGGGVQPAATSEDEDDELAMALALSASAGQPRIAAAAPAPAAAAAAPAAAPAAAATATAAATGADVVAVGSSDDEDDLALAIRLSQEDAGDGGAAPPARDTADITAAGADSGDVDMDMGSDGDSALDRDLAYAIALSQGGLQRLCRRSGLPLHQISLLVCGWLCVCVCVCGCS